MRKLLAILQIFVLMAAMALPTAFAAEAPIMLAGLEAASSSSSTEAQHDWDTNLFFQTMQEKTGIAFSFTEYVSREAWTEAKTEMLAGEVAMPDMFFKAELTPQETLAFYEAGKLIDLRPYLAEYAPHVWALLEANPEWMEAVSLPDGAIVALPSINELTPNNTMWINKTWLDRLKMGVPTTAEELTEVLRLFRDRDMNQNGSRNDEIPLSFVSMWDLRFLAHAFGINADDYYLTEQNGKISEVLTTEENRAFLMWLHELYTEGLLDSQGFMAMRLVEAATSSSSSSSSETAKYGVFFGATPQDVVGVNLASSISRLIHWCTTASRFTAISPATSTAARSQFHPPAQSRKSCCNGLTTSTRTRASWRRRSARKARTTTGTTMAHGRMPARRRKLSPCRARIPFGQPRCPPMPVRKFR